MSGKLRGGNRKEFNLGETMNWIRSKHLETKSESILFLWDRVILYWIALHEWGKNMLYRDDGTGVSACFWPGLQEARGRWGCYKKIPWRDSILFIEQLLQAENLVEFKTVEGNSKIGWFQQSLILDFDSAFRYFRVPNTKPSGGFEERTQRCRI